MIDQAAYNFGSFIGGLLEATVVIGLIVAFVGMIIRSSRRSAARAAAMIAVSPDGRYWWDGANWQDATTTVPPHAPRSPDGAYWWDGRAWHQVPRVA